LLKDGRQATRKAKQAQMWCRTRPYKAKIKYRNTFLEHVYQTTKIGKNRQSVSKKHKLLLKTSRLIFI